MHLKAEEVQLQENLKENPFGFGWQLETLYCTSQLHAIQGQRFQGSLCSGAVGNGVFLAASDCPFPIPLAGCCCNGSGHFYVERYNAETLRLTHATWLCALKATSHHRLGTSTILSDTDPANSQQPSGRLLSHTKDSSRRT